MKKPVDKTSKGISKMVEVTKRLVKKYAIPVHLRTEASTRRKGRRPAIVPKTFGAIWKLLIALPKQIFVPDPKPVVNWIGLATLRKISPSQSTTLYRAWSTTSGG